MAAPTLKISEKLQIPLREFEFSFARSSGPGGQNVNKVNTKATLIWEFDKSPSIPEAIKARFRERFGRRINKEGQVIIVSQRFRDQGRNVADCLAKLQEMLQSVEKAPRKRMPTKPSKRAKQRRLDEKKKHSQKKQDRRSFRPE